MNDINLFDFNGFVGNEKVKTQLSSYIRRGQFPHAVLIEGEGGLGKRMLAGIVAKALLCRAAEGEVKPCNNCPSCAKFDSDNHPDLRVEGGDGSARSFHIDIIREIRDTVYIKPNESVFRVYIFANAQAMTVQAQNALLKMIEEPPRHAIFILTCENRSQMLETIKSRTVHLSLERVAAEEAIEVIMKASGVSKADAEEANRVFNGNIGKAVEGLKEGEFKEILELVPRFGNAVMSKSDLDLLKLSAKFERNRPLADGVIDGLFLLFRDALILREGGQSCMSSAHETARKMSFKLTPKQLLSLIEVVEELKKARLRNMNEALFITLFVSRMRSAVRLGR